MPSLWQLIKTFFSALFGLRRYRKSMETIRTSGDKVRTIDAILAGLKRGDYEGALRSADELKSNDPAYHYFHGSLSMQLGRFAEAEKYLRRCAAMPQSERLAAIAYTSLGHILLETGRYEEAVKCFETSLRYSPERGSTYRDLAETALRRGDPAEALKFARTAV